MINRNEISFLIISTNAIGDSYLSLSAIESIKNTFPNSKIFLAINCESNLLSDFIPAEKIFFLKSKSLYSVIDLLTKLRKIQFDYSLTFFPGRVNSLLLLLSKAKIRAGFRNYRKIENWFNKSQKVYTNIKDAKIQHWFPDLNFLERIRIVLKTIGINNNEISKFRLTRNPEKNIKYESILIHPFSMIKKKSMSITQLQSLVNYLKEKLGCGIILTGGKELNTSSEIYYQLSSMPIDIRGNEQLSSLVELILNSKIFIAVDSFPIHIADSFDSNFIGIFGPTYPGSVLINPSKAIHFYIEDLQQISNTEFVKSIDRYLNSTKIVNL
jgi:ADP-heptose:LPS heptosyltransferase